MKSEEVRVSLENIVPEMGALMLGSAGTVDKT
jgi:hypothetical protein